MKVYAKFVALAVIATVLVFASAAVTLTVQPAKAFPLPTCSLCAKDFAPGQEATSPGVAKNFAPGQEAKVPVPSCHGCAKDFAPGQVKKQPT
jgi:hypothetical protein